MGGWKMDMLTKGFVCCRAPSSPRRPSTSTFSSGETSRSCRSTASCRAGCRRLSSCSTPRRGSRTPCRRTAGRCLTREGSARGPKKHSSAEVAAFFFFFFFFVVHMLRPPYFFLPFFFCLLFWITPAIYPYYLSFNMTKRETKAGVMKTHTTHIQQHTYNNTHTTTHIQQQQHKRLGHFLRGVWAQFLDVLLPYRRFIIEHKKLERGRGAYKVSGGRNGRKEEGRNMCLRQLAAAVSARAFSKCLTS